MSGKTPTVQVEKMQEKTCDEHVFNQIFRKHSPDLHAFLYHKFGSGLNPADMVQEAFVALWRNCAKVLPEKARSYLFTVAQNMTLKQIRKSKSEEKYINQADLSLTGHHPGKALEEQEFAATFDQVMAELPEKQRIAFMLHKAEGMKHKDIAEMLGISQKAVEKRIYTAAEFIFRKLGKKI